MVIMNVASGCLVTELFEHPSDMHFVVCRGAKLARRITI